MSYVEGEAKILLYLLHRFNVSTCNDDISNIYGKIHTLPLVGGLVETLLQYTRFKVQDLMNLSRCFHQDLGELRSPYRDFFSLRQCPAGKLNLR